MKIIDYDENEEKFLNDVRKGLYNDYLKYDYEWFCTLNLPGPKKPFRNLSHDLENRAEGYLKKWRSEMGQKHKIRVAYNGIMVLSKKKGPHIHLLMIGARNTRGQTLLDMDEKEWEKAWGKIAYRNAMIKKLDNPIDREIIAKYMTDGERNTMARQFITLVPYNNRIFKRIDKKRSSSHSL